MNTVIELYGAQTCPLLVPDVFAPGHAAFFLRKTGSGDAAAVIDLRAFSADPRCKSISTP